VSLSPRGEGPHQLSQKRSLALVPILQSLAAAEIANALHLRDFRSAVIFEFFNTIDPRRTSKLYGQARNWLFLQLRAAIGLPISKGVDGD
jgi:hypothetical protein